MVLAVIRTIFAQPDAASVREQLDEVVAKLDSPLPGRGDDARRCPRGPARLHRLPGRPLAEGLVDQPARAGEQGDQAPHRRGGHLPQRGRRHCGSRARCCSRSTTSGRWPSGATSPRARWPCSTGSAMMAIRRRWTEREHCCWRPERRRPRSTLASRRDRSFPTTPRDTTHGSGPGTQRARIPSTNSACYPRAHPDGRLLLPGPSLKRTNRAAGYVADAAPAGEIVQRRPEAGRLLLPVRTHEHLPKFVGVTSPQGTSRPLRSDGRPSGRNAMEVDRSTGEPGRMSRAPAVARSEATASMVRSVHAAASPWRSRRTPARLRSVSRAPSGRGHGEMGASSPAIRSGPHLHSAGAAAG